MAITPEIKKAVIKNQIKVTAKNAVECKINLSEEELGNVILSTGRAFLNVSECHQNEILYGGKITFNVITDLGGLKKTEAGVEFSYKTEVNGVNEGDTVVIDVALDNIKVSMQNGLPVITAAILVNGFVDKISEFEYVKGISQANCKNGEVKNLCLVQSENKNFTLEDEFDLDYSISEVLFHDEKVKVSSVKSGIGSVNIEGEVELLALVLGVEDKKPKIEKRVIPFNIEKDMQKAMPDLIAVTCPVVKDANLKVVVDKAKEKSAVACQIELCFHTEIFENEVIMYTLDGYSTKNRLSFEKCAQKTRCIDGQKPFENKISLTSELKNQKNAGLVCPLFAKIEQSEVVYNNQTPCLSGALNVSSLALGDSGYYIENTLIPFNFNLDSNCNEISVSCLQAFNLLVTENAESVNYSVTLTGLISETSSLDALFIVKVVEGEEIVCNDSAISVYVPNKNDTLWDLSKALGVLEEEILKTNPELSFPLSGEERVIVYREIGKLS